ncbi:MAG: mechanosensitive ion channel family protein, partial [Halobacteriales archaeon]
VVGIAARQTLGSVLAGFVLMFSKPFEVGDWIEVDGREGIVPDITIVNTRMESFDGGYVVIPNDVVETSTVLNRTRKGRLRIRLEVGVDSSVEPGRAEEVAMVAINEVDDVMPVPRPQVVPTGFADSAIVLELRFWIDKPSARRKWRAKAAVLRSVYAAFEEVGIKIPYPQRELSGRQETGGFQVADSPVEPSHEPGAEASTRPEAGITSEQ